MLRMARERISNDPLPREPAYYGAMYARYLIDTELWDEADKWLVPADVDVQIPHYNFARAFAAAKLGQLDKARELIAEIHTGGDANPEIILAQKEIDILKLEVGTVIAMAEGNEEKALDLARQATQMQASMPFRYGPPRISKPTAELLGDVLLELGDDEHAALAYEDQLTRSQLRTNSLLGLARATARTGDKTTSREAYNTLAGIWHSADPTVPALVEVNSNTEMR
jgi:tetratricopeptide (TPR) repeat protein